MKLKQRIVEIDRGTRAFGCFARAVSNNPVKFFTPPLIEAQGITIVDLRTKANNLFFKKKKFWILDQLKHTGLAKFRKLFFPFLKLETMSLNLNQSLTNVDFYPAKKDGSKNCTTVGTAQKRFQQQIQTEKERISFRRHGTYIVFQLDTRSITPIQQFCKSEEFLSKRLSLVMLHNIMSTTLLT